MRLPLDVTVERWWPAAAARRDRLRAAPPTPIRPTTATGASGRPLPSPSSEHGADERRATRRSVAPALRDRAPGPLPRARSVPRCASDAHDLTAFDAARNLVVTRSCPGETQCDLDRIARSSPASRRRELACLWTSPPVLAWPRF